MKIHFSSEDENTDIGMIGEITPFKLNLYNLAARMTMLVIQDLYWNQSRFFISVLSCCCKMNFIKTFSLMHKIYGLHWSPNFIDHEYIKGKFQFSFL